VFSQKGRVYRVAPKLCAVHSEKLYCQIFMTSSEIPKSPILILAFRRFDYLFDLLNLIPVDRAIYIHIDGSKEDTNLEVRSTIQIAQEFQRHNPTALIRVLSQEKNLGNRLAFQAAMDWVFEFEDRIIVLEDDIRFGSEFFAFMDWALTRFKDQKRVFHINGISTLDKVPGRNRLFESYGLWPWGFATWKDRWQLHERQTPKLTIEDLRNLPIFQGVRLSRYFEEKWQERFDRLARGTDTYDIGWNYSSWKNNAIAIQPRFTFTTNLGFDHRSLHTRIRPFFLREQSKINDKRKSFDHLKIIEFPNYFDAYSDFIQWKAPGISLGGTRLLIPLYYLLRSIKRIVKDFLNLFSNQFKHRI